MSASQGRSDPDRQAMFPARARRVSQGAVLCGVDFPFYHSPTILSDFQRTSFHPEAEIDSLPSKA